MLVSLSAIIAIVPILRNIMFYVKPFKNCLFGNNIYHVLHLNIDNKDNCELNITAYRKQVILTHN